MKQSHSKAYETKSDMKKLKSEIGKKSDDKFTLLCLFCLCQYKLFIGLYIFLQIFENLFLIYLVNSIGFPSHFQLLSQLLYLISLFNL